MQESLFAKIYKVLWKILIYFENLFLTVPLWYFEFLEKFTKLFESVWSQIAKDKKKTETEKKKENRPNWADSAQLDRPAQPD
jgi:hypothetical protein